MILSKPIQTTINALSKNSAFFYQPKLNGIRCYLDNGELLTRNGRVITCLPHILADIKANHIGHIPLDGELYTNKIPFQKLNGLIRRKAHNKDHLNIKFHVFDIVDTIATQEQRLQELKTLPEMDNIKIVSTVTNDNVRENYHEAIRLGFEGLIVRGKDSAYGDDIFKIKQALDNEYKVIRLYQGGFECITRNNKTFKVTAVNHGLSVGDLATIEYSALTEDGIPFHGRFKAIRYDLPVQNDDDIEDYKDEPEPKNHISSDIPINILCFMINMVVFSVVLIFTVLFGLSKNK